MCGGREQGDDGVDGLVRGFRGYIEYIGCVIRAAHDEDKSVEDAGRPCDRNRDVAYASFPSQRGE